ncbi:metal ABC transporter substrate-binding protein [Paenibacillus sp. CF384]|uniref:metal ABC transporter substrate-binding protein n=1 Tax=Paenibacillus sp. CF384 TaxID=1884382 RepID=UPI00089CFBBA|nr:metal ABC transporter substrate-binding protein [Paenibacillus sp. CF384]SDX05452.1 zinc transport system substrate-binding protein [Paenibacillus sp. CF384]
MKRWLKASLVVGTGLALVLSGCSANKEEAAEGKLKVVTTFYPMYEFSKQVAGDHADVIALIPSGVEPHDWEPSAKDMAVLKEADVFVYNGIVEGWAEDAIASASNEKRIVVEATDGIALVEGNEEDEHGHEEEEHGLDPHVWLSPVLAQHEVSAIEAALVKADPAHEDDYKQNAQAYIDKLKDLDQAYKDGLKNTKSKDFITQHAAFGYLAQEYGLRQIPIAGLSPEQEPSPEEMAEVVEFAKKHQVNTIFFETLVQPKVAEVVANEIGAKTDVLNPLEGLTDDDLNHNRDYISVMQINLEALKRALN